MNGQSDTPEEVLEELEEIITEEDTDAKYEQKKIDDSFPPVQPEHEEPKRPPIVLQHVTLTYADGRTGSFTGKAIMTMQEHTAANLRLIDVQLSQPQVVAVEPEKKEEVAGGKVL